MGFFTVLLTVLGAAVLGQALLISGGDASAVHDSERVILALEMIHLPWQAAFAFALAWLMRPPRAARKAAPTAPSPAAT